MKKAVAAVIVALACALCGCFDSIELNDLSIVLGMGIDAVKDSDEIALTMQLGQAGGGKSGGGGGESSGNESEGSGEYFTIRRTGGSLTDAVKEITKYLGREMFLPDNQAVFFSEEIAKKGIDKPLDFLNRIKGSRPELAIFVTDIETSEVMTTRSSLEKIPSVNTLKILQNQANLSEAPEMTLLELYTLMKSKTSSALVPIATVVHDEVKPREKVSGSAIIKANKMIGKLDEHETRGALLLRGDGKKATVSISDPVGSAGLYITNVKSEVEPEIEENGTLRINLKIFQTGQVVEVTGYGELKEEETVAHLNKRASEIITEDIFKAYAKGVALKSDFLEFDAAFARKYPKEFKGFEEKWEDLFPTIKLNVKVQTEIINIGKIPIVALENEGS